VKLRVLPSAKQDLRRGYAFYERAEQGIGAYFLDSLSSDLDSLRLFAGIHRRRGELFRFRSRRFPYWIYYRIEADKAYVVAVLDARRDPARIAAREQREQRRTDAG